MKDDDRSPPKRANEDVAVLCGPTPDGSGVAVLRAREGRVEAGVVREMKEGRPLHAGEIVRLKPRADAPAVCDVEVQAKLDGPAVRAGDGPPQIATERYRRNWERIFGAAADDEPAPDALN